MSIQTPLPAAKPNDKKNRNKKNIKNKKTKKIKKNASRKTSSSTISPIITPIKKEEPKENISLAEISKNTIEKIDTLIQKTRKDIRENPIINEKIIKNNSEGLKIIKEITKNQIIDILGEKQIAHIEIIKNKIEKNEIINLSEKTKNQESIETIFPTNEKENNNATKTTFNTKLIEIINNYNTQIQSKKTEIKNVNLQKNIGDAKDNLKLQEELPLSHYDDNNGKKNISIEEELNRLSKGIKNGANLQAYLLTCVEKYLEITPLINAKNQEETIKKELAKVNATDLDTKIIDLIAYLNTKITKKTSSASYANEFTLRISLIINELEKNGNSAIESVLSAINIINKINKELQYNEIFINQRIAEKQAADKEERKKKSVVEKSSQQLEIALKKLNILINKIDKNNMNNAEIKTFIELNLEIIGGEDTKFPIISRNKHIKSQRDKEILIDNIKKLKKTIENTGAKSSSEYQKTMSTILYYIEKYNIVASKEEQKTIHGNIYKTIDNIKAKKWSNFAPIRAQKNKEIPVTEASGNNTTEEEASNIYSETPGSNSKKISQ